MIGIKTLSQVRLNMVWKNLKQSSLADELITEHDALTQLDDVNALVDWQAIEDILRDVHAKRRGNAAWPPRDLKGFE